MVPAFDPKRVPRTVIDSYYAKMCIVAHSVRCIDTALTHTACYINKCNKCKNVCVIILQFYGHEVIDILSGTISVI